MHFILVLFFLTLFDGFANACAFALNAKYSSLLSTGIPFTGFLVTLLHYIYKFFSDLFHWDDFDHCVLFIQLFLNILQISVACCLWLCFKVGDKPPSFKIVELFTTSRNTNKDAHVADWCPIFMLAISLGTVYAFYPSISPYSIIDFQYASIIELWILVISSLLPLLFALLDTDAIGGQIGPSGKYIPNIPSNDITFAGANKYVDFTESNGQKIQLINLQVKHQKASGDNKDYHGVTDKDNLTDPDHLCSQATGDPSTKWHDWNKIAGSNTYTYTPQASDKYWGINSSGGGQSTSLNANDLKNFNLDGNNKPTIKYAYYSNWFQKKISGITITAGTSTAGKANKTPEQVTCDVNADTSYPNGVFWNCVWICAIFYILCIQIFMSMLHYPHSLLSCFFNNNPYVIVFISIFFNTLRELMQACGFAGAGKQCTNFNNFTTQSNKNLKFTPTTVTVKSTSPGKPGDIKLELNYLPKYYTGENATKAKTATGTSFTNGKIKATVTLPHYGYTATPKDNNNPIIPSQVAAVNGSIAATNKSITLFVMMFCVFTGDGYLQHYRRCCRDCWPTTGYNKYQSFFISYISLWNNIIPLE